MKSRHKKYILENRGSKSAAEMAGELGLKERAVKKILASAGPEVSGQDAIMTVPDAARPGYGRVGTFLIFFAVFAAALAVRLVYLNQIKASPFFTPVYNGLDGFFYDSWAKDIAGGNVIGSAVFYGLPLYPYFLAAIYFLVGHSVYAAKFTQAFIGALNCGLIYLIGQKIFNRAAGITASLLFAFYAMDIYFGGFFVSPFLAICLNAVLTLVFISALRRRAGAGAWLASGILIGLSSLANAGILLFLPFAVWLAAGTAEATRRKIIGAALPLLAGTLLAIAPVTIRNYAVSGEFVPVSAHGGITFYAGNNPLSIGAYALPRELGNSVSHTAEQSRIIAERETGKQLKPSEVSAFWFGQGLSFIRREPAAYLKLAGKKAFLFWNAYEIPDIMSFSFFKRYAPLLNAPLVRFSLICPLALLGMALYRRSRDPGVRAVSFLPLAIFIATLVYFVNARYRLIAVPYLALFAGASAVWFFDRIRKRDILPAVYGAFAALAIFAFIHIRAFELKEAQAYNLLGISLKYSGAYEDAVSAYRKASEIDPKYDSPYYNLGLLYAEMKNYAAAIESFSGALAVNPRQPASERELGNAYLMSGDKKRAAEHLRAALELNPSDAEARSLLDRAVR